MQTPEDAATANLEEVLSGLRQSTAEWRTHAFRSDSLGETACRKHLRCLEQLWRVEEQLADLR